MLFTDDTNAFTVNNDLNQLKYDGEKLLLKLCDWFAANKLTLKILTLNIDKTNYSIFHPPRKKILSEYDSLLRPNKWTVSDIQDFYSMVC